MVADATTLTIDPPVFETIKEDGDKKFTLSRADTETSQVNGPKPESPKAIKITPYWSLPPDKSGARGGWTNYREKTYPEPGRSWGDLTVYLDVVPYVGDPVPPPPTLLAYSFGFSGYFSENQRTIPKDDRVITPPIAEWKKRFAKEFPKLFTALQEGDIPLHVVGYASKTGGDWYNYVLSADRANQVKGALQFLIGNRPDIDPNPQGMGAELAKWKEEVDKHAKKVRRPRESDRLVLFWLDPEKLTKVYHKLNPCVHSS
jgi:hypothetical protein